MPSIAKPASWQHCSANLALQCKSRANYSRCKCGACYCIDKRVVRKVPLSIQQPINTSQKSSKNLSIYCLALCVGVSSSIFQVTGLQELLRYSRHEIINGQWWRIVTGNLVHLGYSHLLLNLSGLAVIAFLLAPAMPLRHWVITGVVSMLGVSIGLLVLDPQLVWYVGLSGALYGLLLGGAIALYRLDRLMSLLIGGYTVGKIFWEQLNGPVRSSEVLSGGNVIVNAHLYGMIAGAIAATVLALISYPRRLDRSPKQ